MTTSNFSLPDTFQLKMKSLQKDKGISLKDFLTKLKEIDVGRTLEEAHLEIDRINPTFTEKD